MDWEKLMKHSEALDELTELEKEKAKRAFALLKEELRDDFPKSAFASHHPIVQYITNLAP